jgi:protein-tyrosine phosphatase
VILVVCTGNICRSPMTQALLERHLRERGLDIPVSSAGILGWNEGPAVDEAVAALAERGIELNGHVSRRIDGDLIREAELVLTMTSDHAEAVRLRAPDVPERVFVLGEFVRLAESVGSRGEQMLADWVRQVDAQRPAARRRAAPKDEIPDPLGEPAEVYRILAVRLDEAARRIAALL